MKKYRKILRNREARIQRRLRQRQWHSQADPMLSTGNIHYEMSSRVEAVHCGGIGAFHTLVQRIGLIDEIDEHLHLLKVHLPYHESDHVLNISYNVLVGGQRLEDIEYQRQDVTFLNALNASRLPDPTTAGDFTRRFSVDDISTLMDCINRARTKLWKSRGRDLLREEALIDIDGTLAPTTGWRKQGIGLSYNGVWGYHPLVVSLANTKEILFLENRPANAPSHKGAERWIDAAIDLVAPYTKRVCLRGDTDFALTRHFDRWSERVDFVFGMDASVGLVKRANAVEPGDWQTLNRKSKYEVKTQTRSKPENVRAQIVELANGRCDQENVIEQLKNGVNAMRMPVDNLLSNWAYMVMAALAWNIKAWFALTVRRRERRKQLLNMEFRKFLKNLIWLPTQIMKHGRRTIYRILNYNSWTSDFFSAWETIKKLRPA